MSQNRYNLILPDVVTGIFLGIELLARCAAYTGLIFIGSLAFGFEIALYHVCIGTIIVVTTLTFFSQFRVSIGSPQDIPLAILGGMVVMTVGLANISDESKMATALFAASSCAALTGIFMLLLAKFRMSTAIRLFPFSVVAGFLAATGLLIFISIFLCSLKSRICKHCVYYSINDLES